VAITKVGSTVPVVTITASSPITPAWAGDMSRTTGNLLIAHCDQQTGAQVTASAGWTEIGGADTFNGIHSCGLWWKIATGSDAAPTFTSTGSSHMAAECEEFTGAAATGPQTSANGTATATSGTTLTVTAAAAPASSGGMSVVANGGHYPSSATVTETPGSGWTAGGFDTTAQSTHGGHDYHLNPGTGSADSELVTLSSAPDLWILVIAFFPASAGAGGVPQIAHGFGPN
jgi:hypothetical protein